MANEILYKDKPLIVVANRLPFYISYDENGNPARNSSPGGLVTALAPSVIKSNGYWIGWAGQEYKEAMTIPESNDPTSIAHNLTSSQVVPIFYSDETYQNFYNGMCNASLWPLMHSLSSYSIFKSEFWNAYIDVNKTFSNATLETLKKLDQNTTPLVWIHDYHLLMMPMMLKNLLDEANTISPKIAFFLHIPFPSWDIFRLIPWANELLLGLLGCDLIAFHTNVSFGYQTMNHETRNLNYLLPNFVHSFAFRHTQSISWKAASTFLDQESTEMSSWSNMETRQLWFERYQLVFHMTGLSLWLGNRQNASTSRRK